MEFRYLLIGETFPKSRSIKKEAKSFDYKKNQKSGQKI